MHLFEDGFPVPSLTWSRKDSSSENIDALRRHVMREAGVRQEGTGLPGPGYDDMLRTLASAGLVAPSLGQVQAFEVDGPAWWWSSRSVSPMAMYMFESDVVEKALRRGHFFALSHAGHGINSYGLNLVTGHGPVAAFVQHGYGGGYMDNAEQRHRINETYGRIQALFDAIEADGDARWLLLYSEFRGIRALVDLELRRSGAKNAVERFESEDALFEAVMTKTSGSTGEPPRGQE